MKEVTDTIKSAKKQISGLLWPPKSAKHVFNKLLSTIITKFTESHDTVTKLAIGITDDDQFIEFAKHIYKALNSTSFKEKVEDDMLSISYYTVENFTPLNIISIDESKNFILSQEDINGDLTLSIPIETPKLKEYIDVAMHKGRKLFSRDGFIEEEVIQIMKSIFKNSTARKESLALKYIGNVNFKLSKASLDYKLLLTPELYSIISSIEEFIEKAKDLFHTRFITYANHDSQHAVTVANIIVKDLLNLYEENLFFRLNIMERFLLLSAALLHDIGMGLPVTIIKKLNFEKWRDLFKVREVKDLKNINQNENRIMIREKIRKYHAYIGYSFTSQMLTRYVKNINLVKYADFQNYIAILVAAHSSSYDLRKIEEKIAYPYNEREYPIRLRLLAALLRLADSLDRTIERVDPIKADLLRLWEDEPKQVKHWAYKFLIKKVCLTQQNNKFMVKILHTAPNKEEEFGVKIFEGVNLLKDVLTVTETLKKSGNIGEKELDFKLNLEPVVIVSNIITKEEEHLSGNKLKELRNKQIHSEKELHETACKIFSRYLGRPIK